MHIGVDVGGTNTDAALIDGGKVIASIKAPTTDDVATGVMAAIRSVLDQTGASPRDMTSVMIGTTQFTNAFIEGKKLVKVATFRVALPSTDSLRPMADFPPHLRAAIGDQSYLLRGGFEFDGRQYAELDEAEVVSAAKDMRERGITSAAVSGVFSPINAKLENQVADILRREVPGLHIALSCEIGRVGLIERENATIMNASLADLSRIVVGAFRAALDALEFRCPFFISQNDGTLMTAEFAEKYPVLTFASGPTNSMRGAAFLSGVKDGVVIDIGGTTSDVGVLKDGFPRESALAVDIGSVRTNFRMPDILAIGLGGGSLVRETEQGVAVGPDSVALKLTEKALVFGGDTLTTTDVAVAAGLAEIGDKTKVAHLSKELVGQALDRLHDMLEQTIDKVKSSQGSVPVILVGGGAILVNRDLKGASKVIRPENSGVANAIGAGLAQVGGEVDKIFSYEDIGRDTAMETAKKEAIERAVEAGCARDGAEIISVDEVPLAYLPGGAVRIKAKAIGDLANMEELA
ncbi:N-methylhydantoinase (ATP-hydrolyzing) [Candidatus Rhodobacter oscarellae]|uniref:N-methylhydantoinase (ATP-hydrolyzing) n=1 Tax=Candidatus Rhodobacter oscarellae TaxID=1675527 RepID=A0A0J9EBX3_9RHOB|nr:hydantoinase/oxoprolinase family protein [Candidatus Rhodobacter lobularis]KMW60272.1 N-methylhydantoinase (ATP-hydrolyzing) [Candidatus Rhodobacter lobularis]